VKRLHSSITLCMGLLLCVSASAAAGDRSGKIPPRIASADGPDGEPAWISSESLTGKQGKSAANALPWRIQSVVEQEVREGIYKRYGCIHYGPVAIDRAGPIPGHGTLKALAQNSRAAVKGTITGIDHGFSVLGPGSLLEIRIDEWLKKSDRIADQPVLYLVYPVAEFEAGGYRFCKTDTPQWGSEPQIGDEILVFPYRVAIDDACQVLLPDPEGYEVILHRRGKNALSLSKSLRDDPDVVGVNDLGTLKKRALEYIEKANGQGPSEK
jgi:hypothetical protein